MPQQRFGMEEKMNEPSVAQIRAFRLRAHHLDRTYAYEDIPEAVGACGMQNTPPGAWENALYHRIPSCSLMQMERLLYGSPTDSETGKALLQAWSLRGAPFVFPASESGTFLSALIPQEDEPWIYTRGITLALDYLGLEMGPLFELLKQVISGLDRNVIVGKNPLDQTLAQWMLPFLPEEKRALDAALHVRRTGPSDRGRSGGFLPASSMCLLRPGGIRQASAGRPFLHFLSELAGDFPVPG